MSPRRRRLFRLVLLGGVTLIGLGAAEVALRVKELREAPRVGQDGWHRFDPRRGWRGTPGWEGEGAAPAGPDAEPIRFPVQLNAQGWRDDHDYARAPAPGVLRVAVVGDSFAFGYGVARRQGLCARLQADLSRPAAPVEVLNLGTCAYGVGQMRMVLEEEALGYGPQVVVLGVISHDFRRALRAVSYTGYRKPRYVVDGEGLRLPGVPFAEPEGEEGYTFKDVPPGGGSFLLWKLGLLGDRIRTALASDEAAADPRWRLGRPLVLEMKRLTEAAGAKLVVALFPTRKGLARGEPFRRLLGGEDLLLFDGHPAFEQAKDLEALFLPDGHPSAEGHALLAAGLAEFLREQGLLIR